MRKKKDIKTVNELKLRINEFLTKSNPRKNLKDDFYTEAALFGKHR